MEGKIQFCNSETIREDDYLNIADSFYHSLHRNVPVFAELFIIPTITSKKLPAKQIEKACRPKDIIDLLAH